MAKSWNDLSRSQKLIISGACSGLMVLPRIGIAAQMENFYDKRNNALGQGVVGLKFFQGLAFFYGIHAILSD